MSWRAAYGSAILSERGGRVGGGCSRFPLSWNLPELFFVSLELWYRIGLGCWSARWIGGPWRQRQFRFRCGRRGQVAGFRCGLLMHRFVGQRMLAIVIRLQIFQFEAPKYKVVLLVTIVNYCKLFTRLDHLSG